MTGMEWSEGQRGAAAVVLACSCSLRTMAVNQLGTPSRREERRTRPTKTRTRRRCATVQPQADGEPAGRVPRTTVTARRRLARLHAVHMGWVEPAGDAEANGVRKRDCGRGASICGLATYGVRALALSIDNFRVRLASDPNAAEHLRAGRMCRPSTGPPPVGTGDRNVNRRPGSVPTFPSSRRSSNAPGCSIRRSNRERSTRSDHLRGLAVRPLAGSRGAGPRALRLAVERSGGVSAAPFVAAAEAIAIPIRSRGVRGAPGPRDRNRSRQTSGVAAAEHPRAAPRPLAASSCARPVQRELDRETP